MRLLVTAIYLLILVACASRAPTRDLAGRVAALLPADAVLLGEQHDAPEHQQIHLLVTQKLARDGRLAALALEMADSGKSTAGLPVNADEPAVQAALGWSEQAWPWAAYGPAIMAAVRAGVPVLGANLPRSGMRAAMNDASLDARLPPAALEAQQRAIRAGHCDLLPERQIAPMTRIQLARDLSMARTLAQAVAPGKTVLLLAGSGHVDRQLGIAQHLSVALSVKAVRLDAGGGSRSAAPEAQSPPFDAVWPTPAVPEKDYCAAMRPPAAARP